MPRQNVVKTLEHRKQWEPWIQILEAGTSLRGILEATHDDYKTLVALALSTAKWVALAERGGVECYHCGLCGLAAFRQPGCNGCPLEKSGQRCFWPGTLYSKWREEGGQYNASLLRDHLVGLYRAEYDRVLGDVEGII